MALPTLALNSAHLLSLGASLGSQIFVTFILGPKAQKILTKKSSSQLLGSIFPQYFLLNAGASIILMVTYCFGRSQAVHCELVSLGVAACTSLVNVLLVSPPMIEALNKRMALEAEEGIGDLVSGPDTKKKIQDLKEKSAAYSQVYKRFWGLHGLSMVLNLASLASTACYAIFLGGYLSFP